MRQAVSLPLVLASVKIKMLPQEDIIVSLLQTPFYDRRENEKNEIVLKGRPTPKLKIIQHIHTNTRSFKTTWYETCRWLCASSCKEKLFCWPCLLFKRSSNTWNNDGYCDLKNLSRSLTKHSNSKEHISNCVTLKRIELALNSTTVAQAQNLDLQSYNENVRKNRRVLKCLIDVTLLLGKQGLEFSHPTKESSNNMSNFQELFSLCAKQDKEIYGHYKKISDVFMGESNQIHNDLISCVEELLSSTIDAEVAAAPYFSVQVDNTTDVTGESQYSIILRYVYCGEIKERFMGFYHVCADRSVDEVFEVISGVIKNFDPKNKFVGQCYDGASLMSEHVNELQTKIKSIAPSALLTNSHAHRLDLLLQAGSSNITRARIFFATVMGIPIFFQECEARTQVLDSFLGKSVSCDSANILNLLRDEWNGFFQTFDSIVNSESSSANSIYQAHMFVANFKEFDFAFLLNLYCEIFNLTDVLVDVLQNKSFDYSCISRELSSVISQLKFIQTDTNFERLYKTAKQMIKSTEGEYLEENGLDGIKKEELDDDSYVSSYRMLYYEVFDNIINQISQRFTDTSNLLFLSLFNQTRLEEFNTTFPMEIFDNLFLNYNSFQRERLKTELEVFYNDKLLQNTSCIQDVLATLYKNGFSDILPETYKLACLIATLPATSLSRDHNLSILKHIETYLKIPFHEGRPSGLALMFIEKDLLNNVSTVFYDSVIDIFNKKYNNKLDLVYKT